MFVKVQTFTSTPWKATYFCNAPNAICTPLTQLEGFSNFDLQKDGCLAGGSQHGCDLKGR